MGAFAAHPPAGDEARPGLEEDRRAVSSDELKSDYILYESLIYLHTKLRSVYVT